MNGRRGTTVRKEYIIGVALEAVRRMAFIVAPAMRSIVPTSLVVTSLGALVLIVVVTTVLTTSLPFHQKAGIFTDFPDPAIYYEDNMWYSFASQSGYDNMHVHVQVAESTDFRTWTLQQDYDALPELPEWAVDTGEVWAPDVVRLVCFGVNYYRLPVLLSL